LRVLKPGRYSILLAVAALATIALATCGGPSSVRMSSNTGDTQLTVSLGWPEGYTVSRETGAVTPPPGQTQQATTIQITKITLTITGAGMSPITLNVPLDTMTVNFAVTPGIRTFSVTVETDTGQTLSDSQTVEVVAGVPVRLSFNLSLNSAPVIVSLSASPSSIPRNGRAAVTAVVQDPDGDAIAGYNWTAGGGSVSGSGAQVTFTSSTPGIFAVCVTATDARGATSAQECVNIVVTENSPPQDVSVTLSNPNPNVGDTIEATCNAWDPDGDPLTYNWRDNTGWTATGQTVRYTVTHLDNFTLTCTVTDGQGGVGTAQTTLGAVWTRCMCDQNAQLTDPPNACPACGRFCGLLINDHGPGPYEAGWKAIVTSGDPNCDGCTLYFSCF